MKEIKKFFLRNHNDTKTIAIKLSRILKKKFFICLNGNLGSGKTTFANYLINSLSKKKLNVLSPTFPMVQHYVLGEFNIWHYDLYRLKKSYEIYNLDYDKAINEIIIMEWSEKIEKLLPRNRLEIHFDEDKNFNRYITIHSFGNIDFKI